MALYITHWINLPSKCNQSVVQFLQFSLNGIAQFKREYDQGGIHSLRRILCSFICCFFLLPGIVSADFESDVIDLVNLERATQGLHPLNYDHSLAAAARDHSEDMGLLDYFSHTSLDGRTVPDRITAAGYAYNTYGENIAAGQPTAENVVDSWMSSSGHRANILNPNFCDIGVGYAYIAGSTYGHYWTQDFGRKSGIGTCPVHCVVHGIENRQPEVGLPTLTGGNAAYHVGAVGQRLLSMKGALFAGETLADHTGIFIYENAHDFIPVFRFNPWRQQRPAAQPR